MAAPGYLSVSDHPARRAATQRTRRRLRAEAAVARAGIKMLFPMVLFILPVLFVVTLVPGILSVLKDLKLLGAAAWGAGCWGACWSAWRDFDTVGSNAPRHSRRRRDCMIQRVFFALLFLTASAVAQPPKIAGFVNFATLDTNFGPESELVIYGTFTTPSAGRDYSITVGGQSGGINIAADGLYILATIPPTAPAGAQTLVITYQGQASNALSINVAALAPEFQGESDTISGPQVPPRFSIYVPFSHAANG
jgi:hypothetical protein